jgi:hypothetical protein
MLLLYISKGEQEPPHDILLTPRSRYDALQYVLCCYKAAYKMVKVEDSPRLLSGGVFNLRGGSLIFSTNKSPEPLAAAGAIPTSVANC